MKKVSINIKLKMIIMILLFLILTYSLLADIQGRLKSNPNAVQDLLQIKLNIGIKILQIRKDGDKCREIH